NAPLKSAWYPFTGLNFSASIMMAPISMPIKTEKRGTRRLFNFVCVLLLNRCRLLSLVCFQCLSCFFKRGACHQQAQFFFCCFFRFNDGCNFSCMHHGNPV